MMIRLKIEDKNKPSDRTNLSEENLPLFYAWPSSVHGLGRL